MSAYLWFKAIHIIAVISWMAGLLYLPRLFVYHCDAEKGGEADQMLATMERRLLNYITTPAMIVALLFGLLLIMKYGIGNIFAEGWWHAKLTFLLGLFAFHGMCSRWRKDFAVGNNTKSQKFFRIANEVPTLLMIAIVILVVVKPM